MKKTTLNNKNNEFNKVFVTVLGLCLILYGLYAGIAYYTLVQLYYETVKFAIEHELEYMSISQPDTTLAVACVTTLLGSFFTYCLYNGALKINLNNNGLEYNLLTGSIQRIPQNPYSDVVEINNKDALTNKKTKKVAEDKLKKTKAN